MSEKQKEQPSSSNRLFTLIVIGVMIVVLVGAGGAAWFFIGAGTGEASRDVVEEAGELEPQDAEAIIYQIEPAGSEARFYIDEELNGEPFTVEGITDQVGGQITVNYDNPASSEVGTILINARTLETDSGNRNRALRNFILNSSQDQYEFIRFEPTELRGLPEEAVEIGQSIEFQIVGNLTIVDVTREEIFDATVTLGEDNILSGSATTTVLYPNYELTIPEVRFVANVQDEVRLEFDFVAAPVEDDEEAESTEEAPEA